jgi:2'-5' RNA ligase
VARWAEQQLRDRPDLRPVPEAALHVTLVFLGTTAPEGVGPLWDAVVEAAAGHSAPRFEATGVTGLPRRRPRLFALALADEGGRAGRLHRDVAGALARGGLHEPEERPLWPHVTVARVRRGKRPTRLADGAPPLAFPTSLLTLYRSRPGSDYEVLEQLRLPSRHGAGAKP